MSEPTVPQSPDELNADSPVIVSGNSDVPDVQAAASLQPPSAPQISEPSLDVEGTELIPEERIEMPSLQLLRNTAGREY